MLRAQLWLQSIPTTPTTHLSRRYVTRRRKGRPRTGRLARTAESDRPLCPDTRNRVHILRGAHDPGWLKRYFRDLGWSVRVPRSLKELAAKVDVATEQVLTESGRPPTVEELARRLDTDVENILEARQLRTAHHATSLNVPLADDSDMTLIETIATDDDGYQHAEDAADLDRLLAALPDRERTILRLRFQGDMTQREISQRVGLSQMHVSRLISAAIAELSQFASDAPPGGAR